MWEKKDENRNGCVFMVLLKVKPVYPLARPYIPASSLLSGEYYTPYFH